MKILITHAYTKDNKGDAAILSVMLKQINQIFPKSLIKILTVDNVSIKNTFEGYILIPSFSYLSVIRHKSIIIKILDVIYVLFKTVIWAIVYRLVKIDISVVIYKQLRIVLNEFKSADLIIPIGGGYLTAKANYIDTLNLILNLHTLLVGIILKKPIIMYSQSIGPFGNRFQKFITKVILNKTNLIIARENNTIETLHSMGISKDIIGRSVDAGFLLQGGDLSTLKNIIPTNIINKYKIMGITVRSWLSKPKQEKYENSIAGFVDEILKNNKEIIVIFIPQVTSVFLEDDDRVVAARIVRMINHKNRVINLTGTYGHNQIKTLYNNLDFTLGTRFHSVIFSLTGYVPAIAIEYEYKTSGIMKDLQLSEWVIKIEDVDTEILVNKFNKLIENREKYISILKSNLPNYINQAEKTGDLIKRTYEKALKG